MTKAELDKLSVDISAGLIEEYIEKFETENGCDDAAVKAIFKVFPANSDISQVMAKVTMVNHFYHTRIVDKNIQAVANHICKIPGLDEMLNAGKTEAVGLIAKTPEGINKVYSFASKYCSFSKASSYPIMDGISRGVIYVIGKSKGFESLQELEGYSQLAKYKMDYTEYKKLVDELIRLIPMESLKDDDGTYKKIDMFLWKYGKTARIDIDGREIKFD